MIRTGLTATLFLFLLAAAVSAAGFGLIPEGVEIPRHWNLRGEVNGTTERDVYLLTMPAFVLGIGALLAVLPLIDPRGNNIRASAGFYLTAWIGSLMLITGVHATIVYAALSGNAPDPRFIFAGTGLFLMALGDRMAKSRSNWFAGLRTPWTLSSEHAWGVGNRWAGRLMVLSGIGTIAAAFTMGATASAGVMTAGIVTALLVGTIASWFAWRGDPERAA